MSTQSPVQACCGRQAWAICRAARGRGRRTEKTSFPAAVFHTTPCCCKDAKVQIRAFSSCMFRAKPRISLVSTSKLAGVPASSVFSPLTMAS